MNNLERYLDQVIEQRPEIQEPPVYEAPPQEPTPNFLRSVKKRWYIVLIVVLIVCGVGLPAVWFLVDPLYVVSGAVRFDSGVQNPLTGEQQVTSTPYGMEVNTQAVFMIRGEMLRKIVTDLKARGKDLEFFNREPRTWLGKLRSKLSSRTHVVNEEQILKDAVASETIIAMPRPHSLLVDVIMKGSNLEESKLIVNAILENYKATYVARTESDEGKNLLGLETERKELLAKIAQQKQRIREDASEYGAIVLDPYQEMELQVETLLRTQLTNLKAEIIRAETNVQLLQKDLDEVGDVNLPSEQVVALQHEHINNDEMMSQLSANIVQMERDLIISKRTLQEDNPVLKQQKDLLEDFKAKREVRRAELVKEFNLDLASRRKAAAQQRLERAKAELEGMRAQEAQLEKTLKDQGVKTVAVGRKSLDLQDLQFDLNLNLEYLDRITRRIKQLDLEQSQRSQNSRVEIALPADYVQMEDQRPRLAIAVVFGAVVAGGGLAFLRDKMDKTLQTPDDVTRHLGLPLLGTTTSSRAVKPTLFAEQIAGDYQTIRTNLGLLSNEGIPRKLAVGSPGMREGKTTFAVNLATSLAKSGKNVLLIDGDLRKPDVGNMLSIPNDSGGVQEVLIGEEPSRFICAVPESGLHVLAANMRSLADVYELLASPMAAEQIDRLGREYDHVIIDTPPALAFPDALVWAKMAGSVVLVGFAGQTTAPDLREAKDRFKRVHVHVLGAILSNVTSEHGLYRYGYGYRAGHAPSPHRAARQKHKKLLLPTTQGGEDDVHA